MSNDFAGALKWWPDLPRLLERPRHRKHPLPRVGTTNEVRDEPRAAHEAGVVHRDLKPANVKVTPEGKVKVLERAMEFEPDDSGESTRRIAAIPQRPPIAR